MNMQALLKQAQSMQKDILKAKDEIDNMVFTGNSSFVQVEMNGKREVIKIKIDKSEGISSDEIEMVEDMLMLAFNDCLKQIDKITEEKLGKYSGAMNGLM